MPRYEYLCPKCQKEKEKFLEFDDYREPVYCECGEQMNKLVPKFDWKFAGVTSRTDVEIEVMSQEESMQQMASNE